MGRVEDGRKMVMNPPPLSMAINSDNFIKNFLVFSSFALVFAARKMSSTFWIVFIWFITLNANIYIHIRAFSNCHYWVVGGRSFINKRERETMLNGGFINIDLIRRGGRAVIAIHLPLNPDNHPRRLSEHCRMQIFAKNSRNRRIPEHHRVNIIALTV